MRCSKGATHNQIINAALAFMGRDGATDDQFNELALNLFAYQFENNSPVRQCAMQRARTPLTTRSWRDIPAVPINVFKDLTLSCCAPEDAERTFMTSGTTMGGVRGKSHHPTLACYDASKTKNFKHRFMQDHETIRMGILFPPEDIMPNSSLAHYLALATGHFGTPGAEPEYLPRRETCIRRVRGLHAPLPGANVVGACQARTLRQLHP